MKVTRRRRETAKGNQLTEIAEYLGAGRITTGTSALMDHCRIPKNAESALTQLREDYAVDQTTIEQVCASLRRHGWIVQITDLTNRANRRPEMRRPAGWEDLESLWYIAPVSNLKSIESHGILSHQRARNVEHESMADNDVQDIREDRQFDGQPLHSFANLYINPRNAMLYRLLKERRPDNVAVVEVSASGVFGLDGVLVTPRNAATTRTSWPGIGGLAKLDRQVVFAEAWSGQGKADHNLRQQMMAEVLVPGFVPRGLLTGITVVHSIAGSRLRNHDLLLPISSDQHLFFAS